MREEVGRLVEFWELRRLMKARESTKKTQSSELVSIGGSDTRSEGPSIRIVMQ
ncbi:MAG: hypothetical protein J7K15_13285 [Deltaproteobacteria bacterium]|nr:hypothetical protein [Deltaproteobacteria bacterium]